MIGPTIHGVTPGIYQVCTSANTDYVVAIPFNACRAIVFFTDGSGNVVRGRVHANGSATALTATDAGTTMAHIAAASQPFAIEIGPGLTHLHLASSTAGAIARGAWFE